MLEPDSTLSEEPRRRNEISFTGHRHGRTRLVTLVAVFDSGLKTWM